MCVNLIVSQMRELRDNFVVKLNEKIINLSIEIYSKYVLPNGIFNFYLMS